jgi:dienelactone hydrolase
MKTETFDCQDGPDTCEGYLAYDPAAQGRRPCVLVIHQWAGVSEHEEETARKLAEAGYIGFAIDVFGKGKRGTRGGDNSALVAPWRADRAKLRDRLLAAVTAAAEHPLADPERIAAMGFCFGGQCALDLARSADARVKGAVSLHGSYAPPNLGPQPQITASVLVLHGFEDPAGPPDALLGLAKELTEAKADWEIDVYGHAMHAFTEPLANAPERGLMYNEKAARRSERAVFAFLAELFG